MRVIISVPARTSAERLYVLTVLIEDFMGFGVDIEASDGDEMELRAVGATGRIRFVGRGLDVGNTYRPDGFVTRRVRVPESTTGGLIGDLLAVGTSESDASDVMPHGADFVVPVEILDSTYLVLSGVSEIHAAPDEHGRPSSAESLPRLLGFEQRPVVDELAHALSGMMAVMWGTPRLEGAAAFSVWSTHDVDHVDQWANASLAWVARAAVWASDRKRPLKGPSLLARALWSRGSSERDATNNFSRTMTVAERWSVPCVFNFITDPSRAGRLEHSRYNMSDPFVRQLVLDIVRRGHEVGLHVGYDTYLDVRAVAYQRSELMSACQGAGICPTAVGGRNHYLRWDPALSVGVLEQSGMAWDSTLGYADVPGFRRGAARPFRLWDHDARRISSLIERPLTLMDATVSAARYLGLDPASDAAFAIVETLREATRRVGGTFTVLWHNDSLADRAQERLYEFALSGR